MKGYVFLLFGLCLLINSPAYSQASFESKIYYKYVVGYDNVAAKYFFYSLNNLSTPRDDSLFAKTDIKIVDTLTIVLQGNFNFTYWGGESKVLADLYANRNDHGRKKVLYKNDSLRLVIWYDETAVFVEQSSVVPDDRKSEPIEEAKTRDVFMDLWMLGLTALGIAFMLL